MRLQEAQQILRQHAQAFVVLRRQDDRLRTGSGSGALRCDEFLQHHVRVRATGAKRADTGAARIFAALDQRARPGSQRALQDERAVREIDLRVQRVRVQRRRQLRMPELHQHLGDAGQAGSAFAMADIRLDRADRAELPVLGRGTKGTGQAGDLDRIAERGAGAVCFDVTDGARRDIGPCAGLADDACLRDGARHGVAVGLAAGVDGAAPDNPIDLVASGQGIRQRLEYERANAFAVNETIGLRTRTTCTRRTARASPFRTASPNAADQGSG
jgi:hypothetical protein